MSVLLIAEHDNKNLKPYEIGFISKSKRKVNLHETLKW